MVNDREAWSAAVHGVAMSQENQNSMKTSTSATLTMLKPLAVCSLANKIHGRILFFQAWENFHSGGYLVTCSGSFTPSIYRQERSREGSTGARAETWI